MTWSGGPGGENSLRIRPASSSNNPSSTVLLGLATLELTYDVFGFGVTFGVTVFGLIFPVLTWLVGLAAVWLLWRPDSSASTG